MRPASKVMVGERPATRLRAEVLSEDCVHFIQIKTDGCGKFISEADKGAIERTRINELNPFILFRSDPIAEGDLRNWLTFKWEPTLPSQARK